MKKSALSVRKVRRYKIARYPGHDAPNPLAHPYARPYPFSQKVIQWALATGLVGGTAQIASAQQPAEDKTPGNPFTLESLGLPYMPIMFGTGLPDRMSEKAVRTAAQRAFEAEGIKLDTNYVWQNQGLNLKLDGYDSLSRIGFAVLTYQKLGPGTERQYSHYSNTEPLTWMERTLRTYRNPEEKRYTKQSLENMLKALKPQIPEERWKRYRALADDFIAGRNEVVEQKAFQNLLIEGYFKNTDEEPFDREMLALVDEIISTKSAAKRKKGIKRIDLLDQYGLIFTLKTNKNPYWQKMNEANLLVGKAALALSAKKQNGETKLLWGKIKITRDGLMRYYSVQEGPQIIQMTKEAFENGINTAKLAELEHYFDIIQASMREIEVITSEAKAGKRFVALLDWQGGHTIMRSDPELVTNIPKYPANDPNWKELSKEAREKKIQQFEAERREYSNKVEASKESASIQHLEQEIRQFIRWAKENGRY